MAHEDFDDSVPEGEEGRRAEAAEETTDKTTSSSSADGPGSPTDPIPGYRILKELSRGGQGIVYQAIQESTRRKVALKVMLQGPFAKSDHRRRFEREIALVGSLRLPS